MGKLFTVTQEIKDVFRDGVDDLIDQLGKTCVLYYPPKVSDCPNCIWDYTTSRSSNRYKAGGSTPFTGGLCPVCNGTGRLQTESTESITLLCSWNPKDFYTFPGVVDKNKGNLLTQGYLTDIPKILKAEKMLVESGIAPYIRYFYTLVSEPIEPDNIVQGRYFIALWKRA